MPHLPIRRSANGIRGSRVTDLARVRARLVSVAGLVGRPVRLPSGDAVGRVVDVVVRWSDAAYPPITGLVARVGRRRSFVPIGDVATMSGAAVTLAATRVDVRDFVRRDGEGVLMEDVVDHQLVDVDGVQVVRASDLYLAEIAGRVCLVGVEVGVASLVRRLGPVRWRVRPAPDRVIDWGAIQPVGRPGAVQLDRRNRELRRLRPGDLADLLEALGTAQRDHLVETLDADVAADALEEMAEHRRDAVLRQLPPARAAAIVAEMEPDEAAEALRELDDEDREAILALVPRAAGAPLRRLLGYDEGTAGGIMTTVLVLARRHETVGAVVARLRGFDEHRADVEGVLVVDADGSLLDDVSLFELVLAGPDEPMGALVRPPWPLVIGPDAPLADVVDAVLSNRRGSIVVTDGEGRPIGRILADDVLDALTPARLSLHREVGAS